MRRDFEFRQISSNFGESWQIPAFAKKEHQQRSSGSELCAHDPCGQQPSLPAVSMDATLQGLYEVASVLPMFQLDFEFSDVESVNLGQCVKMSLWSQRLVLIW